LCFGKERGKGIAALRYALFGLTKGFSNDLRSKLTPPQRRILELNVGDCFEIVKSPELGIGARLQS